MCSQEGTISLETGIKNHFIPGSSPVTPDEHSNYSVSYHRIPYTRGRGRAGEGWQIPGNGKKRASCGSFKKYDGCLNVLAHANNKAVIDKIQWHCNSLACPVCAGNAMTRSSDRITHRLVSWWIENPRKHGYHVKPIHVVVCPTEEEVERLEGNYPRLRRIATREALKAGLYGGVLIPHPFRHKDYGNETIELDDMSKVDLSKGWYLSWHFHIIGFGWMKPWDLNGWIVKNIGVRGNTPKDHRIFELARYQLSHCGVNSKYNSYSWIGDLSVNKYTAPPLPLTHSRKCPECGSFMYPVVHLGRSELDDKPEGCYLVDLLGWHYVSSSIKVGSPDRSELNDIYQELRLT